MTLPAARIGDQTAHGGTIATGFPTVLIGNMPAARISDMHTCPMMNPPPPGIPHVGGPIVMGAFTVLVGNMPQARISDMAICVGPPSAIVKGEPTVLVGMAGAGAGIGAALGGLASAVMAVLSPPNPRAPVMPDASIGHANH